jgi:hypothetical protein
MKFPSAAGGRNLRSEAGPTDAANEIEWTGPRITRIDAKDFRNGPTNVSNRLECNAIGRELSSSHSF